MLDSIWITWFSRSAKGGFLRPRIKHPLNAVDDRANLLGCAFKCGTCFSHVKIATPAAGIPYFMVAPFVLNSLSTLKEYTDIEQVLPRGRTLCQQPTTLPGRARDAK